MPRRPLTPPEERADVLRLGEVIDAQATTLAAGLAGDVKALVAALRRSLAS